MSTRTLWRRFWLYVACAAVPMLLLQFMPRKMFAGIPIGTLLVLALIALTIFASFILAAFVVAWKLQDIHEERHNSRLEEVISE